MSESFIFLKKLFLDFPEVRLGRAGIQADIRILSFFYTGYIHYIKRKASEPKQMKWKNSKFDSDVVYKHVPAF